MEDGADHEGATDRVASTGYASGAVEVYGQAHSAATDKGGCEPALRTRSGSQAGLASMLGVLGMSQGSSWLGFADAPCVR